MAIKYRWYRKVHFPICKPSHTLRSAAIHCIVIARCAGYPIGWNWIMSNRALHDAKNQKRCVTNCCYQRHPINSNAKQRSAMKSYRNAMLATRSRVKMRQCVNHKPNDNTSVSANRAIMVDIVSSWSTLATVIHAEMELAPFWKKGASVAIAWPAIRDHVANRTSTIAAKINAKTIAHALMALNRTHASAQAASQANTAKRKFHSARNSTRAKTAPNVSIISHTTPVSVHLATEAQTALRTLTIAKIICVKMVSVCEKEKETQNKTNNLAFFIRWNLCRWHQWLRVQMPRRIHGQILRRNTIGSHDVSTNITMSTSWVQTRGLLRSKSTILRIYMQMCARLFGKTLWISHQHQFRTK